MSSCLEKMLVYYYEILRKYEFVSGKFKALSEKELDGIREKIKGLSKERRLVLENDYSPCFVLQGPKSLSISYFRKPRNLYRISKKIKERKKWFILIHKKVIIYLFVLKPITLLKIIFGQQKKIENMFSHLKKAMARIKEPNLKKLLKSFFQDKEIVARMRTALAAVRRASP